MQSQNIKLDRVHIYSLNRYGWFDFRSQSLAHGLASRVQSEKQRQWLFPILSNGVGWLAGPKNSAGRQDTGTQIQRLTPHISKSYVNGDKGRSIFDLDNRRLISLTQPIDIKAGVDRPSKAARGDEIKETLLSDNGAKTQSGEYRMGHILGCLISSQGFQPQNAPGDVGNRGYRNMAVV
jgi:hypothetical protein